MRKNLNIIIPSVIILVYALITYSLGKNILDIYCVILLVLNFTIISNIIIRKRSVKDYFNIKLISIAILFYIVLLPLAVYCKIIQFNTIHIGNLLLLVYFTISAINVLILERKYI